MARVPLEAQIFIARQGRARMNLDRVTLLKAIDQSGSIGATAANLGVSYKGAWDQVRALNLVFGVPLVHVTRGRKGGAVLTPHGRYALHALKAVGADLLASLAKIDVALQANAEDLMVACFEATSEAGASVSMAAPAHSPASTLSDATWLSCQSSPTEPTEA